MLKPQKIDPGMDILAEQETLLATGVRKYSNADLVATLKEFFEYKESAGKSVLDTQINAILATYKYLVAEREHDSQASLTVEETALCLRKLGHISKHTPSGPTIMATEENIDSFVAMADLLFIDIKNRSSEWPKIADNTMGKDGEKVEPISGLLPEESTFFKKCTQNYLEIVTYRFKDAIHAKDMLQDLAKDYPSLARHAELSRPVVWALAFRGKHDELKSFLHWLEKFDPSGPENVWNSIIEGAVLAEDIESVKDWWTNQPAGFKSNSKFLRRFVMSLTILRLCITSGNLSWGQSILNDLVGMKLVKPGHRSKQMAMILSWAMASGKSVDELERMFDVLCERLELSPRIDEINVVLEIAKFKNDPYYAERLFSLARKKQLRFDTTTYRLEMEWRILAGDIAGAMVSYDRLRSQEFKAEEISPAINQLLLAMCQKDPVPYEQIMDIVGELIASEGVFSAELVAALSKLHLQRGEMHDLADLLHTYATTFMSAERTVIRDAFVRYIFDTEASGGKWDAYTFLKAIFPETSRTIRTDIMQEFFKVRRHDLAMHVFGDMRAAQVQSERPDTTAYASLFEGLAYTRQYEALQIGHNMLRLDSQVEPDTNVRTSLMLAYVLCDKPRQSLAIWDEIAHMQEGPSYKSINVAFRACQEVQNGVQYTKDIWSKLKQQDIEIPKETADSYIAALAAQGQLEEAFKTASDLSTISSRQYAADALRLAPLLFQKSPANNQQHRSSNQSNL